MNPKNRRIILDALTSIYKNRCWWCDCVLENRKYRFGDQTRTSRTPTIDHWITQSAGGSNRVRNLVLACHACNSERRAKTVAEWKIVLSGKGILTKPNIIAIIQSRRAELRVIAYYRERYSRMHT